MPWVLKREHSIYSHFLVDFFKREFHEREPPRSVDGLNDSVWSKEAFFCQKKIFSEAYIDTENFNWKKVFLRMINGHICNKILITVSITEKKIYKWFLTVLRPLSERTIEGYKFIIDRSFNAKVFELQNFDPTEVSIDVKYRFFDVPTHSSACCLRRLIKPLRWWANGSALCIMFNGKMHGV